MNIQDRKKSLTAEDIRRRYNLDDLDKDRKSIKLIKNTLNKVEIEFQNFMDIIKESMEEYQSQTDITVWFFDGIPSSSQPGFTDYANHLGDLYYDRNTGKAYKYVYENSTYTWVEITTAKTVETLSIESSKPDTADNKRIIYIGTPITPYNIGDVWIDGSTYYRCRSSRETGTYNIVDWVDYTQYTDDMVTLDTQAVIDQLKTDVEQNYVTTTALETNTQGIYATVSSTYATKTTVSTLDDEVQQTKTDVTNIDNRLSVEEGKTTSLITQVGDRTGKTTSVTQDISSIEAQISDIADITTSANAVDGSIEDTELQNIASSYPIRIEVHPITDNIGFLYPSEVLYPSETLVPREKYLVFTNTETNDTFTYEIPQDLLYYDSDNYDSFIADYEERTCQIIKKCKYNTDGSVGLLSEPVTTNYDFEEEIEDNLYLTEGDYNVSLLGYVNGYIFVRLMALNAYTAQYATKVEMNSAITQTAREINSEVALKVGNDEIISKINQTPETITIDADKINIVGTISAINDDTTTTIDGDKITTGTITADQLSSNSVNASKIAAGTITADKIADSTITNSKITNSTITGSKIANSTITDANIANLNANKITAGTISADRVSGGTLQGSTIIATTGSIAGYTLNGAMLVGNNVGMSGLSGQGWAFWSGSNTPGSAPFRAGHNGEFHATNAYISGNISSSSGNIGGWSINGSGLKYGSGSSLIQIAPGGLSAGGQTRSWATIVSSTSDKRYKKDIKELTEEQVDSFYNDLKPVSFRYNEKASYLDDYKKLHFGFIAQDILENQKDKKLEELAMIWGTDKCYQLEKDEIIALNTWQIQKLKSTIKELEERLTKLEKESDK